ncbi:hypothetical protein LWI29_020748 [Acer saccharum]|uniref:Uncharacterized protein n=1 Tax=Acer saccharum TaxID=4024 RepID=A0AA39T339_ACESA|nr:hypothetical protein LWI29_020748 [Acer saccharum]
MHVYSWPIEAKVASYDWNSHRKLSRPQVGGGRHHSSVNRGTGKLVECPTTVSEEWISIQLGLRLAFSNLNCRPDRVGSDKVWSMSMGFSSEEEGRPDLDREGGREAVTVNSRDKKESRKGVREQSMRSPIFVRKEVGGGKVLLEKGKD